MSKDHGSLPPEGGAPSAEGRPPRARARGLLTTEEAADYLALSPSTLATKRSRGGGPPFVKLSAKIVRYPIQQLDEWIQQLLVANTAQGDALGGL